MPGPLNNPTVSGPLLTTKFAVEHQSCRDKDGCQGPACRRRSGKTSVSQGRPTRPRCGQTHNNVKGRPACSLGVGHSQPCNYWVKSGRRS